MAVFAATKAGVVSATVVAELCGVTPGAIGVTMPLTAGAAEVATSAVPRWAMAGEVVLLVDSGENIIVELRFAAQPSRQNGPHRATLQMTVSSSSVAFRKRVCETRHAR